ncbi:MAG TPA: STAS domain-containing protein [Candidatus Eisenbacteria bacterium]|nr:STAS domain-containing protein [Candidatus Eisenbacteria bacterium]
MSIRRKDVNGVVILYPKGSFFGDQETDDFQQALVRESESGNKQLVLNLGECLALNSIAIGVLMRAYANYKGRGGEIKLCTLTKRLVDLFTMTGLIKVFDHHETEEQALAAFAVGKGVAG